VPPLPPSGLPGPSEPDPADASEACPGCGAVLAAVPDAEPGHPGASASCFRLFEVTVGGLREEAQADPSAAPLVRLADAAYDAQHPVDEDSGRLDAVLERLTDMLGTRPAVSGRPPTRPRAWRTTVADAAADLDVIDLPVLVESWARAVHEDWASTHAPSCERSVT
jgi:hypothetical protein